MNFIKKIRNCVIKEASETFIASHQALSNEFLLSERSDSAQKESYRGIRRNRVAVKLLVVPLGHGLEVSKYNASDREARVLLEITPDVAEYADELGFNGTPKRDLGHWAAFLQRADTYVLVGIG